MSAYNSCLDSEIPVVYTAVSDPVGAGLADEEGNSVGNITGTSDKLPVEEQLKMMREAAGVAMIDLDDFKMYNDTYGHKAGDRVLDTTVQIIRSCIRKSDILVRYGGDEFLLILPDIEEKNFVERLKKIQEEIHKSQIPGYTKLQLSVSIGGVLTDRETVESAVNRADRFMYQAKIQKNMVVTEDGAFQGSNAVLPF